MKDNSNPKRLETDEYSLPKREIRKEDLGDSLQRKKVKIGITVETVMSSEFLKLVDHYDEKAEVEMTTETKTALKGWLESQLIDVEKYVLGLKTDLEESFHRVTLKY